MGVIKNLIVYLYTIITEVIMLLPLSIIRINYLRIFGKYGNVIIEDNVWIATRCTILPSITIRKGAVVAAGTVVTKDVEAYSVVGGIPARVIGRRNNLCEYNLKHSIFYE
ncbi:DapH/DapD/GlmU-related protein [Treponema sp.]|uniref:DapH/DapD/GlmU-related protein n=1 Tax=Treponema sp. TaxID=166 RepID=UPI003FD76CA8